jgi:PIN domain nuclease of toxin-antitoxin system
VRLLLDTHIALWTVTDSARLPPKTRSLIEHPEARLFVSVVSIWEIAIKFALRRGRPSDMPISAQRMMALVAGAQCEVLPVAPAHALELETLPLLHGDPFDRMLVAQARAEPLRLLTADARLGAYGTAVEVY